MKNLLRTIWSYIRPLPITRVANPIPGVLECTADGFAEVDQDELAAEVDGIHDALEVKAFRFGWVNFTTH